MKVEELLEQMRREFIKVKVLQAILDGLIFFLVMNLFLFLFDFQMTSLMSNLQVVAIMSAIFSIGDLLYRSKRYRLEIYEQKNPELQEVLRTARDNIDKDNIVSQALFDDVLERARKVTSESIIPAKKIVWKTLIVGLLSFLTVMSGLADFQLQEDGGELLPSDSIKKFIQGGEDEEDGFELKNDSGIYGDSSDIDASNLDIQFSINGTGQADSEDFNPAEEPPEELVLDVSGTSLNEDLDLAKSYSLAIKEIG